MAIIASSPDSRRERRGHGLSTELRLDVLGHQALGLEWTAPATHSTDDVLAHIDQALAEALGTGRNNADHTDTDGLLEVPVFVTEGGVFGQDAVTIQRPGNEVEVHVDDDALPVRQLMGLLEQLQLHCIRRDAR